MGFNGAAVKFHPSKHWVAMVVKKEIAVAFLFDTHNFQSTEQPATTSKINQDINDFSWCSKLHDSLILGAEDGTVFLWNVNSSNPIKRFKEHISRITSVDFNPTDDTFITASWDKTVRLWNVGEENCKRVHEHADCVSSAKWNPHEKSKHASKSFDGILHFWDVNGNVVTQTIHADDSPIISLG
ncbi:peroxisome biogenesis protein 7-like [Magnolia sinica]|uniref:peroxisome biogenesis protein 7-like n=1 Tax=Magnolia sinica TaxID=86752 RepID=UPI00265A11F8|nr:peroxisome biogenesis protein 7-like [Magnolia sinica]